MKALIEKAFLGDVDSAIEVSVRYSDGQPRAMFASELVQVASVSPSVRSAAWEVLKDAWRSKVTNYYLSKMLTPSGVARAFEELGPNTDLQAPKSITLYRGVRIPHDVELEKIAWWYGASWTTSLETASFFACDYPLNPIGQPAVVKVRVSELEIAFHIDDGEDEYIPKSSFLDSLRNRFFAYDILGLRIEGRRGLNPGIISDADVARWRKASAERRK